MAKTLIEAYAEFISKQANDLKYAGQPIVEAWESDGHQVVDKKTPNRNFFITHHKNGIRVATRWELPSNGRKIKKHESAVSRRVDDNYVPHGLSPENLKKTLNAHAEASENRFRAKDIDAYAHPIFATNEKTGEYVHIPNPGITTRHDRIKAHMYTYKK